MLYLAWFIHTFEILVNAHSPAFSWRELQIGIENLRKRFASGNWIVAQAKEAFARFKKCFTLCFVFLKSVFEHYLFPSWALWGRGCFISTPAAWLTRTGPLPASHGFSGFSWPPAGCCWVHCQTCSWVICPPCDRDTKNFLWANTERANWKGKVFVRIYFILESIFCCFEIGRP